MCRRSLLSVSPALTVFPAGAAALAVLLVACGANRGADAPAQVENETLEVVAAPVTEATVAEAIVELAEDEAAEAGAEHPVYLRVDESFVADPAVIGRTCTDDAACGEGYQCDFTHLSGCSDEPGVCRVRPVPICTREFRPVCGCDGRTYGNRCDIAVHGVTTAHDGPCPEPTDAAAE